MTNPREVTVSDHEGAAMLHALNLRVDRDSMQTAKQFIAQLIAARVPDAQDGPHSSVNLGIMAAGHNACRDKVLKGV